MKTNVSLLFYMKKQKNYQLVPHLFINNHFCTERAEIPTGRECEPECWNSKTGRMSGTREETQRAETKLTYIDFVWT